MSPHVLQTRAVAAVAALTLLGLPACSSGPHGTDGSSAHSALDLGTPQQGGQLTFDMQQEPTCINAQVGPQFAAQFITRTLVDSLVAQKPDGSGFQPWLATSWQITPDSKHFTFHLRKGVTFSTGRPLDAAAVKANFDNAANPATQAAGAAQFLAGYQSTHVLDPYTLRVNFSISNQPFLQAASTPYLGIQDPTTLTKGGSCKGAVGSGPFVFVSYTPQSAVVVKRNPNYKSAPPFAQHQGPAYLDGIRFQFVPEDATRVGSIQSGQVDAIDGTPLRNLSQLSKQFSVVKSEQPGGTWILHINTQRVPWSDEDARKALRESLDVDGTLNAVYGGKITRAWGALSPKTPSYNKAVENSWKYDPAAANAEFDKLGWTQHDAEGYRTKNGQRLRAVIYGYPNEVREQRPDILQLFKDQLKKVGVDLQYIQTSTTEAIAKQTAGDYDLASYAYVRAHPDQLRPLFLGNNYSRQHDPQINTLLTQAEASTDKAVQDKDYGQVQKLVIDKAYVIPVYVETQLVTFSQNVHGIQTDATGWVLFYDAWKSN
jgi:peptide/nickel transport system substrate-binding protein